MLTCCTISSTLIHHLHNIRTQTTIVSLLQVVNHGEYLAVPIRTALSASQIVVTRGWPRRQALADTYYHKLVRSSHSLTYLSSLVPFANSGFLFVLNIPFMEICRLYLSLIPRGILAAPNITKCNTGWVAFRLIPFCLIFFDRRTNNNDLLSRFLLLWQALFCCSSFFLYHFLADRK